MNIKQLLGQRACQVDKALDRLLPAKKAPAARLAEAIRYSVFSGGKRVRPFLVLEAARMCGMPAARALPLACAAEMVHAYSLVHDDLPAMDDDDVRRGRPTCHRRFDEATAVLVGDALLTLAFEVLAGARQCPDRRLRQVIGILSGAAGFSGMVGGQAADMAFQKKSGSAAALRQVNRLKTGALITACVYGGAVWAGADARKARRARSYGEEVGFLFQLVDDIIDGDGFAALIGREKTYRMAAGARDRAKRGLVVFGKRAAVLSAFADFLFERKR